MPLAFLAYVVQPLLPSLLPSPADTGWCPSMKAAAGKHGPWSPGTHARHRATSSWEAGVPL